MRWFAALGGAPLRDLRRRAGRRRTALSRAARDTPVGPVAGGRAAGAGPAARGACRSAPCLSWPLAPPADRDGTRRRSRSSRAACPTAGLDVRGPRRRQVLDNHVAQTMAARRRDQGRPGGARPTSWCGRRTRPTSTRSTMPTRAAEIDAGGRGGRRADPGRARSSTGRARTTARNAGILWSPTHRARARSTSSGTRCRSREYIPLRSIAKMVSSAGQPRAPRTWSPAPATGCCTGGPFPIGDVICFEVAYDALVRVLGRRRRAAARRADQQRDLRAHRRDLPAAGDEPAARGRDRPHRRCRSSTTGVSAVIAPGRRRSAQRVRCAVHARPASSRPCPLRTTETLAMRLGGHP